MECLDKVKDALLTVTDRVYHYEALKESDQYIVWMEDGQGDQLNSDNVMSEQAIQGAIDYYTKTEDETSAAIQKALKEAKISFYLDSVEYEDETGFIHFRWVFEVA